MCRLLRALVATSLLLATAAVVAGPLGYGDPTQPSPLERPAPPTASEGSGANRVEPPRWTLSSTLIAGDRRIAVINGRSVALGARIDGARLVTVDARGASIEHEGRRIRLLLPPPAGKTITAKTPSGK